MAIIELLGLFREPTPVADALDKVRQLGIPDEDITVLSGIPYRPEMLGRPTPRNLVGKIASAGAILGVLTAGFLTIGVFLLYTLNVGGQPLITPGPPIFIVLFELTMLGTMWSAFFGLLVANRFPIFKRQVYDPHITEGYIGVQVNVEDTLADQVEEALNQGGAQHLQRLEDTPRADTRFRLFWAVVGVVVVGGMAISLLFFYDVLRIPFPTNMLNQDSFGYEEGPRLAAPADAVPIQGPVLIAGQPASQPVPSSPDSLQRGQVLFSIVCQVCHGPAGTGNGPLSAFFTPKPFDLTGNIVQGLPDSQIYLVITQGINTMPSLAENLSPSERWDVINFVRSLKK